MTTQSAHTPTTRKSRLSPTRWLSPACGILCLLALTVFFHFFYPAHLIHREQFSLFIWAAEPLKAYWHAAAPLSRLVGDILTQFFIVPFVGPLIMAAVLTLLGVLTYRLFSRYIRLWALLPAAALVVLETGRQCGLTYPLSSTLQWVGIVGTLILCRQAWLHMKQKAIVLRLLVAVAIVAVGIGLSGWGDWEKRAVNRPEMGVEHMLAVDNAWYYNRIEKLRQLVDDGAPTDNRIDAYYRNLLLTTEHRMGDDLLKGYEPFRLGLFLPVSSTTSYPIVYFSNEAWFQIGDMTNAEHSALLGMLFSPNSVGARPMKRLVEINLINGDEEAAMKYLRMLDKTLYHHRWARNHMPGNRPENMERWMDMKRTLIATTDTVRAPMDPSFALRHLLDDNPYNIFARDYLFAYDLLGKDVEAFMADYDRYCTDDIIPSRIWSEAMLVWLAAHHANEEEVRSRDIPAPVMADFMAYNELYHATPMNTYQLSEKFGHSYWFFLHFAQMSNASGNGAVPRNAAATPGAGVPTSPSGVATPNAQPIGPSAQPAIQNAQPITLPSPLQPDSHGTESDSYGTGADNPHNTL